jgi:hypothetical protein
VSYNPLTSLSALVNSPNLKSGDAVRAWGSSCVDFADDFTALKAKGISLFNDCGDNG